MACGSRLSAVEGSRGVLGMVLQLPISHIPEPTPKEPLLKSLFGPHTGLLSCSFSPLWGLLFLGVAKLASTGQNQ